MKQISIATVALSAFWLSFTGCGHFQNETQNITEGIVTGYEYWIFEDLDRARESAKVFPLEQGVVNIKQALAYLEKSDEINRTLHPLFEDRKWSKARVRGEIDYVWKANNGSAAFLLYDKNLNAAYLLQGGVGL